MTEPTSDFPAADLPKYFSYDPVTGLVLRIGKRVKNPYGHISTGGYIQHSACGRNFFAHRVAWAMTHGVWPDNVDHINGDRKDNRMENLRAATWKQNSRNLLARESATQLKGVAPKLNKFIARITLNFRRYHLGIFPDPIDAAIAYDRAALYFFGEFAATNFSLGLLNPRERKHG